MPKCFPLSNPEMLCLSGTDGSQTASDLIGISAFSYFQFDANCRGQILSLERVLFPGTPTKTAEGTLSSLLSTVSGRELRIVKLSSLSPGVVYSFSVRGCNFLDVCSAPLSLPVSVQQTPAETLQVRLLGASEGVALSAATKLRLWAEAELRGCGTTPPGALSYSWTVDGAAQSRTGPAFALSLAPFQPNAEIGVEATVTTGSGLMESQLLRVRRKAEPPVLNLGPATRQLAPDQPLLVDASTTLDPNQHSGTTGLSLVWSCSREEDGKLTPCLFVDRSGTATQLKTLAELGLASTSRLNIPADSLVPGTLRVTLRATSAGQDATETVEVTVPEPGEALRPQSPVVEVSPLRGGPRPLPSDWIQISARIGAEEDVQVSLELIHTHCTHICESIFWGVATQAHVSAGDEVVLPPPFAEHQSQRLSKEQVAGGNYRFCFSIPPADEKSVSLRFPSPQLPNHSEYSRLNWAGLEADAEYAALVSVVGSEQESEAELRFRTNSPPQPGSILIAPSGQLSFGDKVQFFVPECMDAGWSSRVCRRWRGM